MYPSENHKKPYLTTCDQPPLLVKIRRKTNRCLNCGHTLGEIYNFCPHCGQENNDHNVSFGTFVGDFFSNYFSFDSRIGRSIRPLFLKPGFLTNCFNEGKRMQYVHPLRLYLVVSLIFFFFLSLSTKMELASDDSTVNFRFNPTTDTAEVDQVEQIMMNDTLSDEQVVDSLRKIGEKDMPDNWLERRLFSGGRKVGNEGPGWFLSSFIQNMPIALLLAMPVLALILKLTYYRRKLYYVNHLVHTLHLHSVALLLFSILIVISLLFEASSDLDDDLLDLPVLLLLSAYVFFSFLSVYRQRWWITLLKLTGIGLVYSLVLILTIGVIAVVALLDF